MCMKHARGAAIQNRSDHFALRRGSGVVDERIGGGGEGRGW